MQSAIGLGSGGITKQGAGTGELGGNLSYSGATVIDEGLLRLSGSGTLSGDVQIASAAILELAGAHEFDLSTRLTGNGLVVGDLTMPGTIAPGNSAGALAFTDNLTLTDTSRLDIELGGTEMGINYDVLSITGSADLAGLLDVSLTGDFDPVLDDAFEVLRAESGIFGQFDELTLPALAAGLAWNVVYNNVSMLLQVVDANVIGLPGDFNSDGIVDAADYVVWRKNRTASHRTATTLADPLRRTGRQRLGCQCECQRPRTGNVGDADPDGGRLVTHGAGPHRESRQLVNA